MGKVVGAVGMVLGMFGCGIVVAVAVLDGPLSLAERVGVLFAGLVLGGLTVIGAAAYSGLYESEGE